MRGAQTPDGARGTFLIGPHGPLRDMNVYDTNSTGSERVVADDGASGQWEVSATDGSGNVSGVLSPVWHTGTVVGVLGVVVGLAMILGTSGLAAVVLWPIGALSFISGASVLWATHQARRAARSMSVRMTQVRVTRSWP